MCRSAVERGPPGGAEERRGVYSAVIAELESVERAEPQAAAAGVVLPGERAAGELDAGPGDRLGRERYGGPAHHLQPGALGVLTGEQVQHHVSSKAAGTDTEAREA